MAIGTTASDPETPELTTLILLFRVTTVEQKFPNDPVQLEDIICAQILVCVSVPVVPLPLQPLEEISPLAQKVPSEFRVPLLVTQVLKVVPDCFDIAEHKLVSCACVKFDGAKEIASAAFSTLLETAKYCAPAYATEPKTKSTGSKSAIRAGPTPCSSL